MALDFSGIDPDTRRAIIDFINRAPAWWYLGSRGRVVDDPAKGYGDQIDDYGIGKTVAERLIEHRNARASGQFDDLSQLEDVSYFGQDKLDDLAYTMRNYALHRNSASLIVDGPACMRLLLETIENSRNYLHLSSFLFFNDEAGSTVADALCDRARSGVQVRVLMDRRGSEYPSTFPGHPTRHLIGALTTRLESAGVKVADMQPIEQKLSDPALEALIARGVPEEWVEEQRDINKLWLLDINHVDHRKMVVADGRECIVMSHNIGNEYLYSDIPEPAPGPAHRWHDAATRISGGAAAVINAEFAKRWMLSGGDIFDHRASFYMPEAVPRGSDCVRVVTSRPGDVIDYPMIALLGWEEEFARQRNPIRNFYMHAMRSLAASEVFVHNPYPLDDEVFDGWLDERASHAGSLTLVRPHPRVNDYPGNDIPAVQDYVRWLFRQNDLRLLRGGIEVKEYTRAMTHLKVALVDDWLGIHGSYNLNYRSAKKDLEMNVMVESKAYAGQVRALLFDVDDEFVDTISEADAQEAAANPARLAHSTLLEALLRQIA